MSKYWESRKHLQYYEVARKYIELVASPRFSIMDVGCLNTPVALMGDFKDRFALNKTPFTPFEGVECIVADWLDFEPGRKYNVITCLQVLEHLDDKTLKSFVDKLRAYSDWMVLSVPYMWPVGTEPTHKQDPIDVVKFYQMAQGVPEFVEIIKDGNLSRIVGIFRSYATTTN